MLISFENANGDTSIVYKRPVQKTTNYFKNIWKKMKWESKFLPNVKMEDFLVNPATNQYIIHVGGKARNQISKLFIGTVSKIKYSGEWTRCKI